MTVFGGITAGINRAAAVVIREGKFSQKIVVGGLFQDRAICGNASGEIFSCDFALARYNKDGSLDTSFGDDGKVTTDFGGTVDQAFALAIQRNGKIVLAESADGDFASPVIWPNRAGRYQRLSSCRTTRMTTSSA
jgi:hypothetical protein